MINRLRLLYPKSVAISALNKTGFEELQDQMIQELSKRRTIVQLRIPQSEYHKISEVMRLGHILNQDYDENDVLMRVDLPQSLAGKLKQYVIE
jgi:GTP-binding protein HflX